MLRVWEGGGGLNLEGLIFGILRSYQQWNKNINGILISVALCNLSFGAIEPKTKKL